MDILQREMSFDSCSENARIFVRIIEPFDHRAVKGVVQIAHGMAEHSLLYVPFATYLAAHGYAVAVNDHLGHGKSVSAGGSYGYFGKSGCESMVNDMHKLFELMRRDYPEVPYFILGHSMGSFLARAYTSQYGEGLTGAVYLGTCGGLKRSVLLGKCRYADRAVKKYGIKAHHATFAKLSTVRFNKAFFPNRTPNDWISRDEKEVDRYTGDPLCGFDLTISGYRDILYLQTRIERYSWYKTLPNIPILIVSGDKDPVGDFGKGVRKMADRLKRSGHDVQLILYPGARHAILSETNRDEVYADIFSFLETHAGRETIPANLPVEAPA